MTNLAATDITVDTPTNNFATLNPLILDSQVTLSVKEILNSYKMAGNGCSYATIAVQMVNGIGK